MHHSARPHVRPQQRQLRRGFTLIELLVVTVILVILGTIVVAVRGRVVDAAHRTTCLSNLREIGNATQLYVTDNKGRLPANSHLRATDGTSQSWTNTLAAYLGPNFIGQCPSCPDHPAKVTYGWNDLITETTGRGILQAGCSSPGATLAVAELSYEQFTEHFHFRGAARGRVTDAMFKSFVNVAAHGDSANYLFVDGHVETLTWPEVQRRLGATNSKFIKP